MIRKPKVYTPDQVLPHVIFSDIKTRLFFDGDMIKMSSLRLQCFAKYGTKCVKCGIEGKYFYKEKGRGSDLDIYHLNLYAIDKNGKEILMTKDHIDPKSKGGANDLDNLQPMCQHCNTAKANVEVNEQDLGEAFKVYRERRKQLHEKWFQINVVKIESSNIPFKWSDNSHTCALFRIPGAPIADFYPHTGRWKSEGKMRSGGADKFLSWYRTRMKGG